ncbi:MAG: hypothetical protein FWF34_00355 [Alphaproteobacteria bacterium]|nr:hypothetical protein [Alphaproteobacteria bacterium]MCL2889698.1 hypothetical protein [Alphaproteobacteria bacterium]
MIKELLNSHVTAPSRVRAFPENSQIRRIVQVTIIAHPGVALPQHHINQATDVIPTHIAHLLGGLMVQAAQSALNARTIAAADGARLLRAVAAVMAVINRDNAPAGMNLMMSKTHAVNYGTSGV